MDDRQFRVEVISFNDNGGDDLSGKPEPITAFEGDLNACMKYWSSYASGLNDGEYFGSNQDFGTARFYRIVPAL